MLKSCAAMGIICVSSGFSPIKQIIIWLGKHSYGLYLVHGYFFWVIDKNIFGSYVMSSLGMFLISIILSFPLNKIIQMLTIQKRD